MATRSGYQPQRQTGRDCLAAQAAGTLPAPVWTFAQTTAPALARVLLRPHSQSPGQSARVLAGGYHSALPGDLPRLAIGVESTVRSLDGSPVRLSGSARGSRLGQRLHSLLVERVISPGRTWKHPVTPPSQLFAAWLLVLARVAWTSSLTLGTSMWPSAGLSVSPSILTGKPSRALEWVELFPLRLLDSPDARTPLDVRSGTLRCSEVPHPDTLSEAGLLRDPSLRVVNLAGPAPNPVCGIWHSPCASPCGQHWGADRP